jgi:ABC-type phosphate/phosphonate transport system ATPase subunit
MSNLKSPEVFIAVMGYTGAGKSYFIKKVSGIDTVTIGNGLQSCEFIVQYQLLSTLIDSFRHFRGLTLFIYARKYKDLAP